MNIKLAQKLTGIVWGGNINPHPFGMAPGELSWKWVALLTAASFRLMKVPLVIFFTLQRYFVRGILPAQ
jgi:hypothetical protein